VQDIPFSEARAYLVEAQHDWDRYNEGLLEILDLTDATNPIPIGSHPVSGFAQSVALKDSIALVGGYDGVEILHVLDPQQITSMGVYPALGAIGGITISDSYAFALFREGVRILDVHDPSRPRRTGGYFAEGWFSDMVVLGDYLLLTGTTSHVIRYSSVALPQTLPYRQQWDFTRDPARQAVNHLDIRGDFVYTTSPTIDLWSEGGGFASSFKVFGIADRTQARLLGETIVPEVGDVAAADTFVYLAAYGDGLIVMDGADPRTPRNVRTVFLDIVPGQTARLFRSDSGAVLTFPPSGGG
jgi:hypothetical protein